MSTTKQQTSTRRALSLSMNGTAPATTVSTVHPLRLSWVFWFVHREVGTKVTGDYAEGIKRIGGFASIESFWVVYSHLISPSALPAVTDIMLFSSDVKRPIWEEVPRGAKWTIRLRKGVADRLFEDLVLATIGDQFDEEDHVVGVVLSVRAHEDILSVWSSEAGDLRSASKVKAAISRLLHLPESTQIEYKLNSDLLSTTTTTPTARDRFHRTNTSDNS